jgi:hypothetical protein
VFTIVTEEPTRALARGEIVVTAGAVVATEKLTVTGAAAPKLAPLETTASLLAVRVQVPAPKIVTTLSASTVHTRGVLEVTTGLTVEPTSDAGNSGKDPASGLFTPGVGSSMVCGKRTKTGDDGSEFTFAVAGPLEAMVVATKLYWTPGVRPGITQATPTAGQETVAGKPNVPSAGVAVT